MSSNIHTPRDNGCIIMGVKSPAWFREWFENDDESGFASPEDAVARVLAAVSSFDAGGKIFQAAVAALYGKEIQKNDQH